MNETYKRENHKSYLVLKQEKELAEKNYGIKMLCENDIPGILSMSVHAFNGEKELYYDISSKQSMAVLYEKKELHKEDLELLFGNMKKVLRKLDEYLLDMEYLVIDPKYIYMHLSDESIYFLYAPKKYEDFEAVAYDFAEYILEKICNEDEQAVMYAYGFYRYVKEEQGDLMAALEKLSENSPDDDKEDEKIEDIYFDEETESILDEAAGLQEERKDESGYRVMRTSFLGVLGLGGIGMIAYAAWKYNLTWNTLFSKGESIVGAGIFAVAVGGILLFHIMDVMAKRDKDTDSLGLAVDKNCNDEPEYSLYQETIPQQEEDSYATVLLQENCYKEQRILIGRIKGRKKQIDLSTFPFVIGKSKEQADYLLDDSSVSRVHARFTLRDDVVYLTDLNSTNGTMRNGIPLEPNELVMLEADDEITFGRLTFTYH